MIHRETSVMLVHALILMHATQFAAVRPVAPGSGRMGSDGKTSKGEWLVASCKWPVVCGELNAPGACAERLALLPDSFSSKIKTALNCP